MHVMVCTIFCFTKLNTLVGIFLQGRIESFVVYDGHRPMEGLELEVVRCLGVPDKPTSVSVNGKEVTFHYNDQVNL